MNVLAFTITIADWGAIGGSALTILTVVGGFWKWAKAQAHTASLDNITTGAQLRAELRDENKRLRDENTAQYERIRGLLLEREKLENQVDDLEDKMRGQRQQRPKR